VLAAKSKEAASRHQILEFGLVLVALCESADIADLQQLVDCSETLMPVLSQEVLIHRVYCRICRLQLELPYIYVVVSVFVVVQQFSVKSLHVVLQLDDRKH